MNDILKAAEEFNDPKKVFRFIPDYDWLNKRDLLILRFGTAPFGFFSKEEFTKSIVGNHLGLIEYIANQAYELGLRDGEEKNANR